MKPLTHRKTPLLILGCAIVSLLLLGLRGEPAPNARANTQPTTVERDGQHDFDFEIGTWKSHGRRLLHPLSGSTTWVDFDGITTVRKVWAGRANLVELEADGTGIPHIQNLSLRLYDPPTHRWSLYYASSNGSDLSTPAVGSFKDGKGEFFDTESFHGKTITVRNLWTDITPDSCHFEQAFSPDGGKTWETNWTVTDQRVRDAADEAH